MSNFQNSICGLDDSDISRREAIRSMIHGRTKDIGFDKGLPGNGGNNDGNNGRRGYGGGGGDESGSNEPFDWTRIFLAGNSKTRTFYISIKHVLFTSL